ncbi:lysozyme inhibitor LprI family protein [Bacillus sp. PS06]|uniref:lysozyme inhibitor LprI family protein n=1 Tax=Bacillus sp. PS06 TaxID=2764176 RepID=UPI001CD8A10C|nr:lysozyme inhibitor LprI family protein [Bacillus sp. PS06]
MLLILAACGSSGDEPSATEDNKNETTNSTQPTTDDSTDADTTETTDNNDTEHPDTETNETDEDNEENTPTTETASLKDEYLKKLNETKEEMDELRANPTDSSTYAMKNAEGQAFDVWDGLLNEIYGVLKEQLPAEEMEQLRIEQREWIERRDQAAKEASLKYEGGTMEHLEYTVVLNNFTEERCFELVEGYMK